MKQEHRLFAQIRPSWRGRPWRTWETMLELIGHTHARTGLTVRADLDAAVTKIDDETMDALVMERDEFHDEWNYTIRSQTKEGDHGMSCGHES